MAAGGKVPTVKVSKDKHITIKHITINKHIIIINKHIINNNNHINNYNIITACMPCLLAL